LPHAALYAALGSVPLKFAGLYLPYLRRGTPAGWRTAARGKHVDTALMFDSRSDVRTVHSVFAEQLLRHAGERPRSVDLQIGNLVGPLVPALEHQSSVVHAMVVVEVREERVAHIYGTAARFQKPLVRTGSVIHDDDVAADFEQVPRSLTHE
jgi:hypothetical protein